MTSAFTFALRNSMRWANMSPIPLFIASLMFLVGTHMTDYEVNKPLKLFLYTGFCFSTAITLLPLIQMSAAAAITDAILATGCTMGTLGAIAYNAPSEQFLMWGGALGIGCGAMIGVSLLSIFYPGSPALYNIWMYGGLALFGAFTLYDTQKIIYLAKTQMRYDPVSNALGIYLDAINLFVRFLMIFGNNRNKK